MNRLAPYKWVILAGGLMGAAGSLLAWLGNPVNTGLCISCFLENAVGAVGLHANPRMSYMRPELLGFFLGSFVAAAGWREFRPRSGGVGFGGLGLGVLMIVGSAVFIGCPIKAVLRLAAGDLTSLAGFAGLIAGVWMGLKMLRGPDMKLEGAARVASTPIALGGVAGVALLAALVFVPGALRQSATGGGALHAPAWISLVAGLTLGVVCQRSRFCITGSIRDVILTRSGFAGVGLAMAFVGALVFNGATGQLHVGYYDQPGAHLEWIWSFLGLGLVGWAAVLAGGCPFRQIIKAGEGDFDSATLCVGMILGAVLVQSWQLGAHSSGVPPQGKAVVLLGFAALACLGLIRKEVTP